MRKVANKTCLESSWLVRTNEVELAKMVSEHKWFEHEFKCKSHSVSPDIEKEYNPID